MDGACLSTESVNGLSLSLESVDDIERSDSLALGVFGIRHGISNDTFQERLENSSRLLVNQSGDTLDSSSSSQTSDCRLRDSLNVVS